MNGQGQFEAQQHTRGSYHWAPVCVCVYQCGTSISEENATDDKTYVQEVCSCKVEYWLRKVTKSILKENMKKKFIYLTRYET